MFYYTTHTTQHYKLSLCPTTSANTQYTFDQSDYKRAKRETQYTTTPIKPHNQRIAPQHSHFVSQITTPRTPNLKWLCIGIEVTSSVYIQTFLAS